ncbi:uncharacterized protein LOC128999272 [Macrosteles quadrilineatus]|uniref:uncharacterized protein LOC128999272 n=1 Tax=Macrosteles quadrilineatus TaxID=74068 RepID=UPI0023E2D3F5|nr:uncharacterized protein LOC128999272 [Macrosteles quadrilineatus]
MMEVNVDRNFCFQYRLRTGCFVIGWFDIIYGHAMVLVYLGSMYTGYFQASGVYKTALWLDFTFTIVQLLEGAVLVYGIKYKTVGLVLLSAGVGVVLILSDVVGDVLLAVSFPSVSTTVQVFAAVVLLIFIGIRAYMTFCVYNYYLQLKEELDLKRKLHSSVPDIISISMR